MIKMNMHQAKTNFSKLAQQVEGGEEVVIARRGEPVMRLVPYAETIDRNLAVFAGTVTMLPGVTLEELDQDFAASFNDD